jgi:low temperature requirement protein LtrA
MRDDPVRRANFRRIVAWNAAAAAIWIAGGLADESARMPIWFVALVVDYAAPAVRYVFPGLGRAETTEWTVTPSYISERFKLFIILALGESIIVTGAAFSEHEPDAATLAAFASAFAGAVAMWWIYFHRSADEGEEAMGSSADPGRIARSATYFHLPIVAGIIVTAVADELVIADPTGTADAAIVATSLGGAALFLAGHAIFRYSVFGVVSMPRIIGIVVLAALAPVGRVLSPLALGFASTGVLIGVAIHETLIRPAAEEERVVLEDGQVS